MKKHEKVKCPHCDKVLADKFIVSESGKINGRKKKLSSKKASEMSKIRWGKK